LDQKSRTVKVRINVNNSNGELKPSMFANVTINGKEQNEYPVIPENSVIRSGKKDIVIISLGGGKFRPQEIKLGGYSEGYYQVVSGLEEGNVIVTSAQFLIDSESNLKAAVSQYQSTEGSPDSTGMKNMQMEKSGASKKSETKESNSSPLIRKGIIDLKKIDENKDGKVYEDIMDWNVISDKPGECPICGMTLKEFTLDQAKNNLIEHGFKVK
jgi:Cu(I)/Ag(I) efflux system membrane fusion protein